MLKDQTKILLNGAPTDQISVFDRGLHYGDGVFESIKVSKSRLCLFDEHYKRLANGCGKLCISEPDRDRLFADAQSLITHVEKGVVKIIVSRGEGGRGYAPAIGSKPNRLIILYPYPDYPAQNWQQGVSVRFCTTPLANHPCTAGIKHLNRLEQIMASLEWDDPHIAEGLMVDTDQRVIEGIKSNVFFVKNNQLITPDLEKCGVQGIMRDVVMQLAQDLKISNDISEVGKNQLLEADEIFLTNSVIGIWPVNKIDQKSFPVGSITSRLIQELAKLDV